METSHSKSDSHMRGESIFSPNRVEAAKRERQAMDLRIAGQTYEQIAESLGYADHSGAYRAIQHGLTRMLKEPAEELRQIELATVNQLQAQWWNRAIAGEKDAADMVLKLMQRRARLLGLDAPTASVVLGAEVGKDAAVDGMLRKLVADPLARQKACELVDALAAAEAAKPDHIHPTGPSDSDHDDECS
jgi:hypothetical protein